MINEIKIRNFELFLIINTSIKGMFNKIKIYYYKKMKKNQLPQKKQNQKLSPEELVESNLYVKKKTRK